MACKNMGGEIQADFHDESAILKYDNVYLIDCIHFSSNRNTKIAKVLRLDSVFSARRVLIECQRLV